MGYHKKLAPKGVLGKFSKIEEEMFELTDAHSQDNPVLELVEISDLLGALDAYTKAKYQLGVEDILKMTRATESAFKDGSRK